MAADGLPRWFNGKESIYNAGEVEMRVLSLCRKDPLEEEMATHFSNIAQTTPWTEEPGRLQSMRSQRVGRDWAAKQPQRSTEGLEEDLQHTFVAALRSSFLLREIVSSQSRSSKSKNRKRGHRFHFSDSIRSLFLNQSFSNYYVNQTILK